MSSCWKSYPEPKLVDILEAGGWRRRISISIAGMDAKKREIGRAKMGTILPETVDPVVPLWGAVLLICYINNFMALSTVPLTSCGGGFLFPGIVKMPCEAFTQGQTD